MGNRVFGRGGGGELEYDDNRWKIPRSSGKKYANPEKTSLIWNKIADSEKLEYDKNREKYLANPEKTSLFPKKCFFF